MPAAGKKGNKGGGRKPIVIEFGRALKKAEQRITDEILSGKAKNITLRVLNKIEKNGKADLEVLDKIVMPVTLKGMTDKSKTTLILPKPLLGGQSSNGIPNNDGNEKATEINEEN